MAAARDSTGLDPPAQCAKRVPDYAKLLDACMDEIIALSGKDLDKVMKERNALIFINSPHRKTAYHIDRECSWLFQIQGRKTISVFDWADREVLPGNCSRPHSGRSWNWAGVGVAEKV